MRDTNGHDSRLLGGNLMGEGNPPPDKFRAIAVDGRHACGIRMDGSLICWGGNPQVIPSR